MSKFGQVVTKFKNCESGLEVMKKEYGINVLKENVSNFLVDAVMREEIKRVYQKEAGKKFMLWL